MSDKTVTLNKLSVGESGCVINLENKGGLRRRLQDIGIIKGTRITCVNTSPLNDPKAYIIRGAVIALRNSDARNIYIEADYR